MIPTPVAVDEQLPEPEVACSLLCTVCRRGLLYQRQERPRFPRHFFWCRASKDELVSQPQRGGTK